MPYYLNFTLATNQNNNNGTTTVSQGSVAPEGASNLFPNQDIDGSGLVSTNVTTQFVSDSNVVSSEKILPTTIDRLVYDSSSDSFSQDIKEYFGKPVIVASGTLTTTDTFSSFSYINNPISSFVVNDLLTKKADGYMGFRATTVYRLVVNANRFQQGRYAMCYCAMGGVDAAGASNIKWYSDHMSTLVQRTTLPHVELDLCCDTEVTLKIPFNSALNFFPIAAVASTFNTGTLGILHIFPYVPLSAATGNLTCGYTLYSHFEDVELVIAAIPQSGRAFSTTRKGKSESQKEQDGANIGPLSSSLIKVRDAASILAKVPLLSAYASSVSWFADIGASAAKVFGWSKPVTLAPSMRVTQNYLPWNANTDGPDMSFPLSLSYENAVGMANGFSGTDVDEMSFSFLATMPVYTSINPWTTAQASGTTIGNFLVGPTNNKFTTTVNTATFTHYTPFQFIAEHFKYWRGSIVYKLKFVKTEFHSGRLMIAFSPYDDNVVTPPTVNLTNSSYLHRQIIDIREANEFTFIVPYISAYPYRVINSTTDASIGNLVFIIVDPLVAPATVNQSISIIVERAAGPDFEFAVPRQCIANYYTGIIPQSGDPFSSISQAATVCSNLDSTIGSSLVKSDNSVNALHCIGEKITSFRTLLKMPQQLIFSTPPTSANYLNILPFSICTGTVVTTVNTAPPILNDLYARLASCFVYSRGGVRLKYVDNAAVTIAQPISVFNDTRVPVVPLTTSGVSWSALNGSGTSNITDRNSQPAMFYRAGYSGEVQIPQYHYLHSRPNSDCVCNATNGYNTTFRSLAPLTSVVRHAVPLASIDAAVLRAISDDGNFGNFLSVPPMTDVTATF